jgi:hypothetical protein
MQCRQPAGKAYRAFSILYQSYDIMCRYLPADGKNAIAQGAASAVDGGIVHSCLQ